ncbi:MAG: hypothetical protein A2W93_06410 [Bacteroidetes bacterium GWF2_43_63]|nr:MAG: hypothetical protein A2W94_08125 [Bacteroidetes bacterium GWE2_42_42]OFY53253.1 MAG: hypothetical protein A2W93_06410 [Bacteroidetes bacterium GWF2_43_63]HBG71755.1 hypothetical protein [Bacteroidales bacterium]HCB61580.1 hypothetical protein [Bacteroidales bacterium]HCY22792.1 hypothetical protein [Bacteroidales bacterium]
METNVVVILICSGLLVGFINTMAGGATIISLSVLTWLGLPLTVANGTNRLAVFFQTLTSVSSFQNSHLVDWKKSLRVGIPTVIGSVAGSFIAVKLNEDIIRYAFVIIMIIMLAFILFKPSLWLKGNAALLELPVKKWNYPLFFVIGVYGGFLHVGVGYYLLAAIVLGLGLDLMKANVMKNLLVMLYVPFSLIIFIINDQVMWKYGLIHAIGNVIGAFVASRMAIKRGSEIIRWVMIVVIVVLTADMAGLINIKDAIVVLLAD